MKSKDKIGMCMILLVLILLPISIAFAPTAPDIINSTERSINPEAGWMLNNSGGTITTLNLNATTQNYRWKGFVGNINGEFALMDSSSSSLYDWDVTTISGEIYATRNNSIINWADVSCATDSIVEDEQDNLSISTSNFDSINNTFNQQAHDEFYVGYVKITQDSCKTTALNVNNTEQTEYFQELLLTDGNNLIYASLLEDSQYGFDNQTYDFQMIVAENAALGQQPNEAYYFYVELI